MADSSDDKTEEPTGKRLSETKEKGQVLQSKEFTHFVMIGMGAIVILYLAPLFMVKVLALARVFLERPHELMLGSVELKNLMTESLLGLGMALMVPLVLLFIASLASHILQSGFNFTTEPLLPKLNRISILSGVKRIFSLNSLFETAKNLVKLAVVGGVGILVIAPAFLTIDSLLQMSVGGVLGQMRTLLGALLFGMLAVIALIAAVDYLYQRFQFMEKLRMTRQEVKDEHKQLEGDPLIRNRIRKLRMQKARQRMMQAVPTATVVVTNPTHFAVALKYDPSLPAPILVAKGADFVAQRIRLIAAENQIPIVENPPVARALYNEVEVEEEIRPDHYKAVAEIISFVMKLKQQAVGAGGYSASPVGLNLPPEPPANPPENRPENRPIG
ncbi:MAG: flagellar biosynthesis protein FlhB [Candidatus Pacebacteria bacterium]|nr:flagellar biosynthesis protein FlhB [Candidatus Paceibacterota bacterium]